jgi:hypothetical protein
MPRCAPPAGAYTGTRAQPSKPSASRARSRAAASASRATGAAPLLFTLNLELASPSSIGACATTALTGADARARSAAATSAWPPPIDEPHSATRAPARASTPGAPPPAPARSHATAAARSAAWCGGLTRWRGSPSEPPKVR